MIEAMRGPVDSPSGVGELGSRWIGKGAEGRLLVEGRAPARPSLLGWHRADKSSAAGAAPSAAQLTSDSLHASYLMHRR